MSKTPTYRKVKEAWELATNACSSHQDRAELEDAASRMEDELDAAAAQLSALEVDAQRYQWLRDKSEPPSRGGNCAFYLSVVEEFKDVKFKRETVDAQIDAALSVGQQEKGRG